MMIVEMYDQTERLAVIEAILDKGIAGHACDTALYPRVAGKYFRLGQSEILH
jgi:hypothetical protein